MQLFKYTLVFLAALVPHHHKHHHHKPMPSAVASWYDDQTGQTASGWHSYYGVANKFLRFGTRIRFYYRGHSITARVDDRGPYIYGRDFDLNQNTARALGFNGVASVQYQYVR